MKSCLSKAIFSVGLAICAVSPALSADSLFDARGARTPDVEVQSILGPKSASLHYDKRMIHAAQLAAARARKHSTSRCWHWVKDALVAAKLVPTRPTTVYAKEAGQELQTKFGFTKLKITNPYEAPLGSVLVYGGRGAGHVELRTWLGFASDFTSATPSPRPLIGVYVKRS